MSAKHRVLIVEDEATSAILLEYQLLKLGCAVAGIASSGEEALELVRERRPDLVFMDIHLEGNRDGIETARLIGTEAGIPVVFMTATLDAKTLERAGTAKPHGYLNKPFTESDLLKLLHTAVLEDC